ncbi:hypothetical protein BSG1_15800 [Bacillus sp. SG-1]|nr:hypothetical protein BSG1_15800 [Bacillus sp. SG-1]
MTDLNTLISGVFFMWEKSRYYVYLERRQNRIHAGKVF